MTDPLSKSVPATRAGERDCWNTIGVQGDRSCAELEQHVHCRNCPVHASAAAALLDRPLPDGYLATATEHFAAPKTVREMETRSVVIFRLGPEWLALPTAVLQEIAALRTIHSLPHRRNGVVLGVGNVRGELLVCVSLGQILGLDAAAAGPDREGVPQRVHRRLLVVQSENQRWAFPVEEVHGIHRFHPRELTDVPATVGRAAAAHTSGVLPWRDHAVGVLDGGRVFHSVNRSLT